mmetsp:Transcript_16700/g.25921  ORF Transcript_16700/g.25921 Transcript_16700/m.25921 type:complete len:149 (-) Transcript_16700:125-571(-)
MCFCKELHAQSLSRRVQFNETLTVATYKDNRHGKNNDQDNALEKQERWYDISDLIHFKNYARQTSRLVRDNASMFLGLSEEEFCMRGLEYRISRERRERSRKAIHTVLAAQHKIADPDKIAIVSKVMTSAARRIAITAGSEDYHAVYP